MCEVSAKNIELWVVVARQIFQIFRQNTWFLENNRALSKFLYGILHYLIGIIKFKQNHSIKNNFILTTQATLKWFHFSNSQEYASQILGARDERLSVPK